MRLEKNMLVQVETDIERMDLCNKKYCRYLKVEETRFGVCPSCRLFDEILKLYENNENHYYGYFRCKECLLEFTQNDNT